MNNIDTQLILARESATAKETQELKNTIISLKDITVSYDGEQVLAGFNLDIHDGEFVTLLGPSGCGKTTALRTIAGFIRPDKGDVFFYEKKITELPPHKREVNTIFQKYALFPHLNVFENIAFGLRMQRRPDPQNPKRKLKLPETEIRQRVEEMLEIINLKGFENRRPDALSGGQQQRVAIARALIAQPEVIFADEPTGNLDSKSGGEVMELLKGIRERMGKTLVIITHDNRIAAAADRQLTIMDGVLSEVAAG